MYLHITITLHHNYNIVMYFHYWLSWSHCFESFMVAIMTWLTSTDYTCHKWPRIYALFVVIIIRSFPHSWLITGFVTRETQWVPHVEQKLLTLPDHTSSPPVISGVHVARSLVFCVMFYRSLFVLLAIALSVLLWFMVSDYPLQPM